MIQTLFGTPEPTFLEKMKQAVTRTRENLSERIDEVMAFTKEIDQNTLDDLEAILISADIGTATTEEILGKLREKADRKQIKDGTQLKQLIKEQILDILKSTPPRGGKPFKGEPEIVMVVGVNGRARPPPSASWRTPCAPRQDRLLCAADTFRAAAIEQLEIWGSRTGVEVIKTKPGGDPSAVLYDALNAAQRIATRMRDR